MANDEHLAILEQGVVAWNKCRKENLEIQPNLKRANLANANLANADFTSADLSNAKLNSAELSSANLIYVNLRNANLMGANLTGAILEGAGLIDVNLSSANLTDADFKKASLHKTTFTNIDLSKVKGLDSVDHFGPSEISISTLYKSGGKIPEAFLRGCGVPDTFIIFARSLVNAAIDFYSCFISYSSKNQDIAERLYAGLQSKGVRCWFAPI